MTDQRTPRDEPEPGEAVVCALEKWLIQHKQSRLEPDAMAFLGCAIEAALVSAVDAQRQLDALIARRHERFSAVAVVIAEAIEQDGRETT